MTKLTDNVKKWYCSTYPKDELGSDIREKLSFLKLYELLASGNGDYVYDLIGVSDSIVRERIFERLSKILNIEYDYIYQLWLNGPNFENI